MQSFLIHAARRVTVAYPQICICFRSQLDQLRNLVNADRDAHSFHALHDRLEFLPVGGTAQIYGEVLECFEGVQKRGEADWS